MQNQTKITNLKSLRLAKAQLSAQLIISENEIHNNLSSIKNNLFSIGSSSSLSGFSSLLELSNKKIAKIVSSLIITKWIKPKSKLLKKASIFFSTLFLQKYSSKLTDAIAKLIPKDIQEKLDE